MNYLALSFRVFTILEFQTVEIPWKILTIFNAMGEKIKINHLRGVHF